MINPLYHEFFGPLAAHLIQINVMKPLKNSQPSDLLRGEFAEGSWNIIVGVLIDRMICDDDAFSVRKIYIIKTIKVVKNNLPIVLNINSSLWITKAINFSARRSAKICLEISDSFEVTFSLCSSHTYIIFKSDN